MTWFDYYANYYDWSESTQYTRLSQIKDLGPATSSDEVTDCLTGLEEKAGKDLLRKAVAAGVRFTGEDVIEILNCWYMDDELAAVLLRSFDGELTGEQMIEIFNLVPDEKECMALLSRQCDRGIYYAEDEIIELANFLFEEPVLNKMLEACDAKFSADGLDELINLGASDKVARKLAARSGLHIESANYQITNVDPLTQGKGSSKGFSKLAMAFAVGMGLHDGLEKGFRKKK